VIGLKTEEQSQNTRCVSEKVGEPQKVDKYLAKKRGQENWMFVDLEKAFDTVVREALWWKLWRKGISAKFIEAIRGKYSNVKISVKPEENRITQEFDSTKGLRQGCALWNTIKVR
jgi:hypothetical protein